MCCERYCSPLGQSATTCRQIAKAPRQGPQERKHRLESSVQARASEYKRGVCVCVCCSSNVTHLLIFLY